MANQHAYYLFYMRLSVALLISFAFTEIVLAWQPSISINEVMASNLTTKADMVDFSDFSDWIELYNNESEAVDISGFFITDKKDNPTKWQVPTNTIIAPKGFLLIWADGFDDSPGNEYIRGSWPRNISFTTQWNHTNFKLAKEGEFIGLYNGSGVLIDSLTYPTQTPDVSYGRKPDGGDSFFLFGEPTPESANSTEGINSTLTSGEVSFSQIGGFFENPLSVELSSSGEGIIRFTLDGSEPSSLSDVYTNPISITETTILSARVFEGQMLPGKVRSATYLISENRNLPAFSIITDNEFIMGKDVGIYLNSLKEREIPINLEYFPLDQNPGFSMTTGMRIGGENIYRFAQKPLNIYARGDYGESVIEYQIFDHLPYQTYKRLYLRNSGDDWPNTMFRDGMIASIIRDDVSNSVQAYRPSVLYLNGDYWGIYNLREKLDKQYFSLHYGTSEADLDHLEADNSVIEGSEDGFTSLLTYASENDLSDPIYYEVVASQVDIQNLMDFVIVQSFIANSSWSHNREVWRDRGGQNKWKWVLVDMDRGFNLNRLTDNRLEDIINRFDLFQDLIANEAFRNEFIQRYSERVQNTFNPARIVSIVDSLQNQIADEMPRHIEKWGTFIDSLTIRDWGDTPGITSMNSWEAEVEKYRSFANQRSAFALQHLTEQFDLSPQATLTISSDSPVQGKVEVSGFLHDTGIEQSYFQDVPLNLEAFAPPGFTFKAWKLSGNTISTSPSIEYLLSGDTELTIEFEPISDSFISSTISGSLTLTASNSPYFVTQHVTVDSTGDLNIEAGVNIQFEEGTAIFVQGQLAMEGTSNQPIVLAPYYDWQEWGGIFFDHASDSSELHYVDISRTSGIENHEHFFSAISALNSSVSLNHVTIHDVRLPISSQFSNMTINNSILSNASLIGDYINVNGGNFILTNSLFEGNNIDDMDAIDIGMMEGTTIIEGNVFKDFVGDNTDGIDVGDASDNVQIINNQISNCGDKAISIGQGSSVYIAFNTISGCTLGVGIKDSLSYGEIVNNTFHANSIGVAAFEKVLNRGGGTADIVNSIFSNSEISAISADESSNINVSYSISDTEILPGENNLFEPIKLVNPKFGVYYPQLFSPVLGSGDPTTPVDGGGAPINIGALNYQGESNSGLVINEINYNSSELFDPEDWVEFFNTTNTTLDLSNWVFIDGSHQQSYSFKDGTKLSPKSYITISRQPALFSALFPNTTIQPDSMSTGLSGSGESLFLYNNSGFLIDSLTFKDSLPWPINADGNGSTLELINPYLDNGTSEFWKASEEHGSPGEENSIFVVSLDINSDLPDTFTLSQNYPNPFNPETIIEFSVPVKSIVYLEVFDIVGRKVATILDGAVKAAGRHHTKLDASLLSSGVYIYRLKSGSTSVFKKMTLIK